MIVEHSSTIFVGCTLPQHNVLVSLFDNVLSAHITSICPPRSERAHRVLLLRGDVMISSVEGSLVLLLLVQHCTWVCGGWVCHVRKSVEEARAEEVVGTCLNFFPQACYP